MKSNANINSVNDEVKEMAKSARKKTKKAMPAKKRGKSKKPAMGQTLAAEYVSHLLELHKLQGVLLTRLHKEIQ